MSNPSFCCKQSWRETVFLSVLPKQARFEIFFFQLHGPPTPLPIPALFCQLMLQQDVSMSRWRYLQPWSLNSEYKPFFSLSLSDLFFFFSLLFLSWNLVCLKFEDLQVLFLIYTCTSEFRPKACSSGSDNKGIPVNVCCDHLSPVPNKVICLTSRPPQPWPPETACTAVPMLNSPEKEDKKELGEPGGVGGRALLGNRPGKGATAIQLSDL